MAGYSVLLDLSPSEADVEIIRDGLSRYNVRQVPALLNLPDGEFAIFKRDQRGMIQGGVIAEIDWGMLYIDLLWLDTHLRGKQYGKVLLHSIEQAAVSRGISHTYLMTTEFQALHFYQHMGYRVFGVIMNRPHGYAYYYLHKKDIQPSTIQYNVHVTQTPTPADVRTVNRGLRNYCEQFVDCTSHLLFGVVQRDDGRVVGGILGTTYWDWYDLRYFWVADEIRGKGYGKRLMQLAEAECRRRGMIGIVCDTADFQALPFYQSQGFTVFATLDNRPPGHTSYFLQKLLTI